MKEKVYSKNKKLRIRFVGKITKYFGQKKTLVPIQSEKIPRLRRSGSLVFHLPEGEIQKKGFEHPLGEELLRRWSTKFKKVVGKGDYGKHSKKRKR